MGLTNEEWARRFRVARSAHALETGGDAVTLRELARRLSVRLGMDIPESRVRDWRAGSKPPQDPISGESETIRAIALELGADYDWLRGATDEGEPRVVTDRITLTAEERISRAAMGRPEASPDPRELPAPPHPADRRANGTEA